MLPENGVCSTFKQHVKSGTEHTENGKRAKKKPQPDTRQHGKWPTQTRNGKTTHGNMHKDNRNGARRSAVIAFVTEEPETSVTWPIGASS